MKLANWRALGNSRIEAQFMYTLSILIHKDIWDVWRNPGFTLFWSQYPEEKADKQLTEADES